MKDDIAKKGADALLKGAKMLGYACPVCKLPLYQFPSGEIRCIYCDKEVKIVRSQEEAQQYLQSNQATNDAEKVREEEQASSREDEERQNVEQKPSSMHEAVVPAFNNLSKKIESLSQELLGIDDPVEIMKKVEVIRVISEVMKALKEV